MNQLSYLSVTVVVASLLCSCGTDFGCGTTASCQRDASTDPAETTDGGGASAVGSASGSEDGDHSTSSDDDGPDTASSSSLDDGASALDDGNSDDDGSATSLGDGCTTGSECTSGFCADGYCCDTACDGQCESCAEEGMEGSCMPVTGEPRGERSACDGEAPCRGRCDGSERRTCVMPGGDTVCEAASCAEGVVTAESVCNGAGACTEPNVSECASAACKSDGSSCDGSCSASDCGADGYCDPSGACFDKLANGETCSSTEQCASGNCVDGVCCDTACAGLCESCGESGLLGTCQVLTGDPLPTRGTCDGSGVCQGQCNGANGGACTYPDNSTECSAAMCSDGEATPAARCNGSGECSSPTAVGCESGACNGTVCSGSCTPTSCGAGAYCATNGACAPLKGLGQSCTTAAECTAGNCADGVCCGSACTGQCQVCNSSGVCVANVGAPVGGRAACIGAGTDCEGFCDGSSESCVYPDSSTVCQDMTCSMDLGSVNYRTCNGAGTCSMSESDTCSGATYCGGSGCVAKKSNISSCDLAIECASGHCATDPTAGGLCCSAGLANCGGSCVNTQTSAQHCGGCNQGCVDTEECQSGTCECVEGERLSCGSCGAWTFESGSTDRWQNMQSPAYGGSISVNLERVTNAQDPVTSGRGRTLAAEFFPGGGQRACWSVPICGTGSANMQSKTLSVDVYIEIDSGELAFEGKALRLEIWDSTTGDTQTSPPFFIGDPDDLFVWYTISTSVTLSTATHVGVTLLGTGDAVGRVYTDNVTLVAD